jgi:hypothetical protein
MFAFPVRVRKQGLCARDATGRYELRKAKTPCASIRIDLTDVRTVQSICYGPVKATIRLVPSRLQNIYSVSVRSCV